MPRLKDKVWLHWKDGLNQKVICIYCGNQQLKHTSKCKKHTMNCKKVPQEIKARIVSECSETSEPEIYVNLSDDDDPASPSSSKSVSPRVSSKSHANQDSTPKRPKQPRIDQHVFSISRTQHQNLALLWTKSLITANIPFEFCNNKQLRDFFEALGSGFTPPFSTTASTTLLNSLDVKAKAEINELISKAEAVAIEVDSWENVNGVPVVNFLLSTTEFRAFFKSIETGSGRATGEKAIELIEPVIQEIGADKVTAILTDQGPDYRKARRLINAKYPSILSINCASHILNNLAKDMCKISTVDSLLKQARAIVVEMKHKLRKARFKEEFDKYASEERSKGRKVTPVVLTLPSDTRWFGLKDMIEKLLRSQQVLLRLAVDVDFDMGWRNKNSIKDDAFWKQLEEMRCFLFPIINGIALLERDAATISEVIEVTHLLSKAYIEDGESDMKAKCSSLLLDGDWDEIKVKIIKRFSLSNFPLFYYASNMLDPRFRGNSFEDSDDLVVKVLQDVEKLAAEFGIACFQNEKNQLAEQLTAFRQKTGIFEVGMLHSNNPLSFWRNIVTFKAGEKLARFAIRLLLIPAASAGVERSFSVQGSIHTKVRNRLGPKKIDKVMRVKWATKHNMNAESLAAEEKTISSIREALFIEKIHEHEEEILCESDDDDLDDECFWENSDGEVSDNGD